MGDGRELEGRSSVRSAGASQCIREKERTRNEKERKCSIVSQYMQQFMKHYSIIYVKRIHHFVPLCIL